MRRRCVELHRATRHCQPATADQEHAPRATTLRRRSPLRASSLSCLACHGGVLQGVASTSFRHRIPDRSQALDGLPLKGDMTVPHSFKANSEARLIVPECVRNVELRARQLAMDQVKLS